MWILQREIWTEKIDVKKDYSKLGNKAENVTVCLFHTILGHCSIKPTQESSRSVGEGNFDSWLTIY